MEFHHRSKHGPGGEIKIQLLKAGIFEATISDSAANNGSKDWQVPAAMPVGNDYMVVISSSDGSIAHASGIFSILSTPQAAAKAWGRYR